jgi:AmmeMemoRadiSam system protein B
MLTMGPIVAGLFYPADPGTLKAEVHRLLGEASAGRSGAVRGLIVPHAGYRFSGPVAASAYALVEAGHYERIVLVGPSHFARFPGVAQPVVDTWTIPLGEFPIDALEVPGLERRGEPFRNEHSLEVQLPFLHETVGPLPITPIATGEESAEQLALVLDAAVGEGTLLVVSTDLSHYLPYEAANRRDMETATAVISGHPERLGRDSACGLIGLQAALLLAQERGWAVNLLDLRNSGDTDGDRTRVVGYGAFALEGR